MYKEEQRDHYQRWSGRVHLFPEGINKIFQSILLYESIRVQRFTNVE